MWMGCWGIFFEQALRAFGKPRPITLENWPARGREILKACGIDSWRALHEAVPTFWTDMPVLPEAEALLALLGGREAYVLTSPPPYPPALSERAEWLRRLTALPVIFCNDKRLLAKPGRLLIDDARPNCAEWEAAGGTAFLWEQPWNCGRPGDNLDRLRGVLETGAEAVV